MLKQSISSAYWQQCNEAADRHAAILAGRVPTSDIGSAIDGERLERVPEIEGLAIERILGSTNAIDVAYLADAMEVSRCVACLRIQDRLGREVATGTGFMVSPRLLLTAGHLIPTPKDAVLAVAWFEYERDTSAIPISPKMFRLDPEAFFHHNPELDFTLTAVEEIGHDGAMLNEFGFTALLSDPVTVLDREKLTVIQHQGGGYKQVALRSGLPLHATSTHLHFQVDHLPAAPGSPIFNDQWEVVAVQHAGVIERNEGGKPLNQGGEEWDLTQGQDALKWMANEGVRASAITAALMDVEWADHEVDYIEELFEHELLEEAEVAEMEDEPLEAYAVAAMSEVLAPATVAAEQTPSERPGMPKSPPETPAHDPVPERNPPPQRPESPHGDPPPEAPPTHEPPEYTPPPEKAVMEFASLLAEPVKKEFDMNVASLTAEAYKATGFDEKYLPNVIRFPRMLPTQKANLARTKAGVEVLDYEHFSIVMNGRRKLPFFVAANIKTPSRAWPQTALWFYDSRIPSAAQPTADFYSGDSLIGEPFVQADLVAWGQAASRSQMDAHHFTNTAPLHKAGMPEIWHSLDRSILAQASDGKATVFAGPVFGESDPLVRGIRVPLEYWKVVCYIKASGVFSVAGFKLTEAYGEERNGVKVEQCLITEIEHSIGLDFNDLRNSDALLAANLPTKVIEKVSDLVL